MALRTTRARRARDGAAVTSGDVDAPALAAHIGAALEEPRLTVLSQARNPHAATFDTRVVRCRWPDGSERLILCKIGARHPDNADSDYGSVAYEASVYANVLSSSGMAPLECYGSNTDSSTGTTWLVLEYLEGATRPDHCDGSTMFLAAAAAWIGRFHGAATELAKRPSAAFLQRFDVGHYCRWMERTAAFVHRAGLAPSWLPPVATHFRDRVELLTHRPATVIHGDYYADNVLLSKGAVHPVDWGWSAVAAGELDLAALIDRWPEAAQRDCIEQYVDGRWPRRHDTAFAEALQAARLYHAFRWLGHSEAWIGTPRWLKRLQRLHRLATSEEILA